jgi:hypothetical protein
MISMPLPSQHVFLQALVLKAARARDEALVAPSRRQTPLPVGGDQPDALADGLGPIS